MLETQRLTRTSLPEEIPFINGLMKRKGLNGAVSLAPAGRVSLINVQTVTNKNGNLVAINRNGKLLDIARQGRRADQEVEEGRRRGRGSRLA